MSAKVGTHVPKEAGRQAGKGMFRQAGRQRERGKGAGKGQAGVPKQRSVR